MLLQDSEGQLFLVRKGMGASNDRVKRTVSIQEQEHGHNQVFLRYSANHPSNR